MGMAASQARFLSLTARKTNVEFEGQQVNQQRTSLSNESADYYSRLCNMAVPTPPSSEDYSKTIYTFEDGSEKSTINSLIAQKGGWYILNYTQSYETESVMTNGNVIISKQDDNTYMVGATKLRTLGSLNAGEQESDPYLSTITEPSQLENVLKLEKEYLQMLNTKYGEDEWYVRYQKNSTDGNYVPVFYNATQVKSVEYSQKTGASLTGVRSYTYGKTTENREIQNAPARVTQDTNGRFMSVIIYTRTSEGEIDQNSGVEYMLKATTQNDDRAYNDAMNQYNYEKSVYEQELNQINSKIEIVHGQDKDLELRLKQLDTEQNAISQEMEVVKKVISKNVETTFKTFNA